jgi:hypothetical protein
MSRQVVMRVYFVALAIVFLCIQSSFGGASEDHTIRLNIHYGAESSITDKALRQAIQSAEDCLNQAFQSAGSHTFHLSPFTFHLSLKVDAATNLSSRCKIAGPHYGASA